MLCGNKGGVLASKGGAKTAQHTIVNTLSVVCSENIFGCKANLVIGIYCWRVEMGAHFYVFSSVNICNTIFVQCISGQHLSGLCKRVV